ncbi:TPA: hypothetical protein ACPY8P_001959, partial [Yersinia enterocolitica]
ELTNLGVYITHKNIVAKRLLNINNWKEVLVELSVSGRKEGVCFYYPAEKPDIDVVDLLRFYHFTPEQANKFVSHMVRIPGKNIVFSRGKKEWSNYFCYSDELVYLLLK